MANVVIQAAVANDKGRVRKNNEDSFLLNGEFMSREKMNDGFLAVKNCRDVFQLYAVCDGMGGVDAGEEASYMAVSELARYKGQAEGIYNAAELTQVLRVISDKIYSDARAHQRTSGTTIVMLAVRGNSATLANVGDSRIYRFRDGNLTQTSVDHSEVQRLLNMNLITPEEARTHPRRHVITQHMGMPPEIRISPTVQALVELREGDVYLLCSDGLTDMVDDPVIERVLRAESNLKAAAQNLVDVALANGGKDNVTVMLLRVQEVQHRPSPMAMRRTNRKIGLWLTLGRILLGGALLMTITDYIYFLLH